MTAGNGSVALSSLCEKIVDCEHKTAPADPGGDAFCPGTRDIKDGRLLLHQAKRVNDATFSEWTARLTPRANDIILTREAPVGEAALVPDGVHICLGQRTVLLRPNEADVVPAYLLYLLLTPEVRDAMNSRAEGSTVPHLNVADIRGLPVPVRHDLVEQARIAETLGTLDRRIELNRQLGDTLLGIAVATFESRFPAARVDEAADACLADIADVVMGQSPPSSTYSSDPDDGPVLVQGVGGFGNRFPSSDIYCSAPKKVAEAGALLMSVRAPVGELNVCKEQTCVGRGVAAITSEYPAFVEMLLRLSGDAWRAREGGTIFPAVNGKQVRGLPLRLPPGNELMGFEADMLPLRERLNLLEEQTQTVVSLRGALLRDLFSRPEEALVAA